jgi:predicted GTPase
LKRPYEYCQEDLHFSSSLQQLCTATPAAQQTQRESKESKQESQEEDEEANAQVKQSAQTMTSGKCLEARISRFGGFCLNGLRKRSNQLSICLDG